MLSRRTSGWGESWVGLVRHRVLFCYHRLLFLDGDISLKKGDELTKKRNVLKKFEL